MDNQVAINTTTSFGNSRRGNCEGYLLFHFETHLSNGLRASLYFLGLAYCFIGLSSITARFFRSMENVVKQTREVIVKDPYTNVETVRHEKVWNFAIADITLLAFGTSFPQISLATIDAIRNIGQLYAGGLGPGTLVGSAAFDLFPIHAICVIVPKAGTVKKISDIGVWLIELFWSFWAYVWLYIILKKISPFLGLDTRCNYCLGSFSYCTSIWIITAPCICSGQALALFFSSTVCFLSGINKRLIPKPRDERPDDWVPDESLAYNEFQNNDCSEEIHSHESAEGIVDIFSIHSENCGASPSYHNVADGVKEDTSMNEFHEKPPTKQLNVLSMWKQHFLDVVDISDLRKTSSQFPCFIKVFWKLVLLPWRFMFAFVPPYQIAHGWVAFICSLVFISGVAYVVTKITDLISCVSGINPYVIAFTALAGGTSWPDLVASKIAAERQLTADSAIANITCSNSVNVGIGVPWLIDTVYNYIVKREPLRIENAAGLSFSLIVFFITSAGCISVLVFRRLTIGAELGGPRIWAWLTAAYFMILWLIFVVLSSMKVSGLF